MKREEIEDGMGCAGLVPSAQEKAEQSEIDRLSASLAATKKAAGFCDKHKPDGGSRNCLVCGCEKLSLTLSRISYLCGQPNEMQVSEYATHYNEEEVVKQVEKLYNSLAEVTRERNAINTAWNNVSYVFGRVEDWKDLQHANSTAEIIKDLQSRITTLEAANKGLVEWSDKAHSMLRAFRHSMDTEKPFPSAAKLSVIIDDYKALTTPTEITDNG